MIKHQLFIGAALIAGVAIGYFAAPAGEEAPPPPQNDAEYVAKSAIADKGDAAALAALRARVKELEAKLVGDREEDIALISNVVDRVRGDRRGRGGQNPGEWMENLKKADPARFAQMTNRFAQWRSERLNRQQSKLDFLASVDTSHMSASARKTHERLQDLIVRREEIEDEMHADPNMSWEERGQVFARMREVDEEIRRLNGEERKTLLNETARELGLGKDDAAALSSTIQDILTVTDNNPFGRGGPGRGGNRGGRGR